MNDVSKARASAWIFGTAVAVTLIVVLSASDRYFRLREREVCVEEARLSLEEESRRWQRSAREEAAARAAVETASRMEKKRRLVEGYKCIERRTVK